MDLIVTGLVTLTCLLCDSIFALQALSSLLNSPSSRLFFFTEFLIRRTRMFKTKEDFKDLSVYEGVGET